MHHPCVSFHQLQCRGKVSKSTSRAVVESWSSRTPGSLRSALTRAVATSCCRRILVPQGLRGRGAGTDFFGYFNVRLGNQKPQLFPSGADEVHGTAGAATGTEVSSGFLRSLPSHGHSQNTPHLLPITCACSGLQAGAVSLLPVALWRAWPPGTWCQDEGKQAESCSVLWAPELCL